MRAKAADAANATAPASPRESREPDAARRVASWIDRGLFGARSFARGLALLAAGAPGAVACYVILVAILSLLPILQVWLGKGVVDTLAGVAAGKIAPAAPVVVAGWYAITLVATATLEPVRDMLSTWLRDHGVAEIDRQLMRAGERLVDLSRIERPAFGDELRVIEDVVAQAPSLFRFLQNGLGTLLTLSGLLLLLGRLHPLLPLALVALSVPHVVVAQRASLLRYRAMIQRSRAAREMDYCARVTTEPAAAKELRVFGLGDFFLHRFQEHFAAALREVTVLRVRELCWATAFAGLHACALVGGFWYVAVQVGAGQLTVGELALYLGAVAQGEARLLFLSTAFGTAHQVLLQLPRLFAFLDSAGRSIAVQPAGQGKDAPPTLRRGISLRGVSFRYPESPSPVLEEVDAFVPAGKVTALVGINGAGKSTLVKLLTRMYDPTGGDILLDGLPLWQYHLDSLRGRIAVVYQDFARFSLTLRENIAIGGLAAIEAGTRHANRHTIAAGQVVDAVATVKIEAAAQRAGADAVAAKLPQGYDTPLTRRFAGGADLSGGEWQKVATARAFVRDAALVILDEPTAALDAEAEYRLFEQFRDLAAGKTALLISHRFSTVRMADHILVLENGRIVEAGSHEALLALGGRYATLYEMQAGRYR